MASQLCRPRTEESGASRDVSVTDPRATSPGRPGLLSVGDGSARANSFFVFSLCAPCVSVRRDVKLRARPRLPPRALSCNGARFSTEAAPGRGAAWNSQGRVRTRPLDLRQAPCRGEARPGARHGIGVTLGDATATTTSGARLLRPPTRVCTGRRRRGRRGCGLCPVTVTDGPSLPPQKRPSVSDGCCGHPTTAVMATGVTPERSTRSGIFYTTIDASQYQKMYANLELITFSAQFLNEEEVRRLSDEHRRGVVREVQTRCHRSGRTGLRCANAASRGRRPSPDPLPAQMMKRLCWKLKLCTRMILRSATNFQ